MALDATQKAKIRRYLCYPDSSVEPHFRLESAFDLLSVEGEVEVESILADIAAIETTMSSARADQRFSRVEDVWFRDQSPTDLRAERARLAQDLAAILGVPYQCRGGFSGPTRRG